MNKEKEIGWPQCENKKKFDDRGIHHVCIDGWNCVWDLIKLFIIVCS